MLDKHLEPDAVRPDPIMDCSFCGKAMEWHEKNCYFTCPDCVRKFDPYDSDYHVWEDYETSKQKGIL